MSDEISLSNTKKRLILSLMKSRSKFQSKNAVVTGAASGLGLAISQKCLSLGMSVVMVDINADELARVSKEFSSNRSSMTPVVADIGTREGVKLLKATVAEELEHIDLLINCAGVFISKLSWEMSLDDWDFVRSVNLDSAIRTVQAFVPDMIERGQPAHIVNVGSVASFLPSPAMSAYTMSKFALRAFTETLKYDLDLVKAPIDVSFFAPGPIDTAIMSPADSQIKGRDDNVGKGTRALMAEAIKQIGMSPVEAADILFQAIENNQFWVFTHPEMMEQLTKTTKDILDLKNPSYQTVSIEGQDE